MHVLFQDNAWVDTDVAVKIADLYKEDLAFAPDDAPNGRLFFFDNLDAHESEQFQTAMKPLRGRLMTFPPNMTDVLQPGTSWQVRRMPTTCECSLLQLLKALKQSSVDAGVGRYLKHRIATYLDDELENAQFMEKWTDGKFTTRERRVLITKWAGQAWDDFVARGGHKKYFTDTGCLMPTDGSTPAIKLQGLPTYRYPPYGIPLKFEIQIDTSSDESSSDDDNAFDSDVDSNAAGNPWR